MSYTIFARSALAVAIASLSMAAFAQESEAAKSPEEISGPADPIVVTATRTPTRYNMLISDVSVVDEEQIRNYGPQAPISDVLANEPGITTRTSGGLGATTSVSIRGASSSQTVLLVDGLRLNSLTTGQAPWAYLPTPQIGRMEIVRGPTSSSYGSDAIGGVIQLFTRRGEGPMKVYADVGYGTYNTTSETVGVEGSQEGFSYSVYGSNTHSVSFPTYAGNSAGAKVTTPGSYTNSSVSANFIYTIATGQEVGIKTLVGSGNNGQTNIDTTYVGFTPVTLYQMATQTESLNVLSAYSKNQINDFWTSLVRVGSSQDNSGTQYSAPQSWMLPSSRTSFNTTQKQAQWQNDFKLPVGKAMVAYEYLNQASYVVQDTQAAYSRSINSIQGGWNADIGKHLMQLNIRNDANSQFGNATTGSLGYGYFVLPSTRLTGSWGTGFQAPTFNDLYYPNQSFSCEIPYGSGNWGTCTSKGSSNLQPTKSQNTEAGVRFDNGVHRAGVIYYYNNITNLVQWTETLTSTTDTWQPSNVGRSVLQGVTTTYAGKVYGGLDVTGSIDYQDSLNPQLGQTLAYHPYVFGNLSVEKNVNRWKLGAQMQSQGNQQTNPGDSSNRTLGGYTLFNLYGSLDLVKDISAYFRVNNVFDKQYVSTFNGAYGSYRTPGSTVFVGLRFQQK